MNANAVDFSELMELFEALCDQPSEVQRRRIETVAGRDLELARQLEAMLQADAEPLFLDDTRGVVQYLPDLNERVVDGRWRLDAPLGRGAGGEVWSAEDIETGEAVAVKILHPQLMRDPEHVARFRREFALMSRLAHDHCLRLISQGEVGDDVPLLQPGQRFIVTELTPGGDLSRLIRASTETLLGVLVQLLSALDHLHTQGVVHRDVKPSNILLTADEPPQPKLADFGIAKVAMHEGTELTGGEALLGTLDYLSPEQVRGEPLDHRSDLFAVGCLIHTLWTGRPPYDGAFINRLMKRLQVDAPSLASRAPEAPAELCALTDQLLMRDKNARPSSAREVAERLNVILESLSRDSGELETDGPGLFPSGLVGRESLSHRIEEKAQSVKAGTAAIVALVGASGIGKTTLARNVVRGLSAKGWSLVLGSPAPIESPPPFWPFAELRKKLRPGSASTARMSRSRDGSRVVQEFAEQITAGLDPDVPTCIFLEDLHVASRASLAVLKSTLELAKSRRLKLLLLVTARPSAQHDLAAITNDCHVLSTLSRSAAVQLAERVLGAGHGELPPEFVNAWPVEVAGHPLLLRSALQALVQRGDLERHADGSWTVTPDAQLGHAIADVLDARFAPLSAETRRVLTVAAALGVRFDVAVLGEVCGGDVAVALAEALRHNVISLHEDRDLYDDGTTHRFEHASLAERLLASAPREVFVALHDRIGARLSEEAAKPSTLAHYLGRGSDPRKAVTSLWAAAEHARSKNDHGVRADHLRRLLDRRAEVVGEITPTHAQAQEHFADALALGGAPEEALRVLKGLDVPTLDRTTRARLLRKRGVAHLRTAAPADGMEALRGALRLLEGPAPRTRWGRSLRLGWDIVMMLGERLVGFGARPRDVERAIVHRELAVLHRWVDLHDGAAHLARFARLAWRLKPAHFRVDASTMASWFFVLQALPSIAARFQQRAQELATDADDLEGLARLAIIRGGCELMMHDDVSSFALLEEGVALTQQTGDPMLVSFALTSQAWAHGVAGYVPDALRDFSDAQDQATESGALWLATDAMCGRMLSAAVCGDLAEAQVLAREVLGSDMRFTFPIFEELAIETLAGVAFVEGRYADASAGYEQAAGVLARHRLQEAWGWLLPMCRVEALCCLADTRGADAVPGLVQRLKNILPTFRRMDRLPLYVGCEEVARGVVAARQGDAKEARRRFSRAKKQRGGNRDSYIDTWVRVRIALEELRLGADRAEMGRELDQVDAAYRERGLAGMQRWLRGLREELRV